MGHHEATRYWEDTGLLMLMGGIVLPIVVWFLDLQISYALVKWACEADRTWVLRLIPFASLAALAGAGWLSWSCWIQLRHAQPSGGAMEDRSYLLALLGLGLNVTAALLILFSVAPRVLLSPCE